jgi:hypothetical protein
VILDTAFVLDLLDDDTEAKTKLDQLQAANTISKIPTMALLELYVGIEAYTGPAEERRIREILDGVPRIEMGPQVAKTAGRMIGERDPSTYKRRKGDAVIAATAETCGEAVVTRNVSDFEQYGVPVESY